VRSHGLLVTLLVLVGVVASTVVYFKTRSDGAAIERERLAAVPEVSEERGTARHPKYDFYTDLPQRELVVPQPPPPEQRPAETPESPRQDPETTEQRTAQPETQPRETQQATAASPRYLVQAGAFNLYSQADRARASLSILGIQARIEEGSHDGLPIYRVRIGPVSESEADSISRRLSNHDIASLKMRAN
jgi:cell division protein FtsN